MADISQPAHLLMRVHLVSRMCTLASRQGNDAGQHCAQTAKVVSHLFAMNCAYLPGLASARSVTTTAWTVRLVSPPPDYAPDHRLQVLQQRERARLLLKLHTQKLPPSVPLAQHLAMHLPPQLASEARDPLTLHPRGAACRQMAQHQHSMARLTGTGLPAWLQVHRLCGEPPPPTCPTTIQLHRMPLHSLIKPEMLVQTPLVGRDFPQQQPCILTAPPILQQRLVMHS